MTLCICLLFVFFPYRDFREYWGIWTKNCFTDHRTVNTIQLVVAIKGTFSGIFFFWTSLKEGEFPRTGFCLLQMQPLWIFLRNNRLKRFFKIGVLKIFAIFTGKHFFAGLGNAILLKRDFYRGLFLWILQSFYELLFYRTPLVAVSVIC